MRFEIAFGLKKSCLGMAGVDFWVGWRCLVVFGNARKNCVVRAAGFRAWDGYLAGSAAVRWPRG